MATSLETLLQDFAEEYGIGKVGTCTSNGSTTTIIDATRFSGPFSNSEWPRRSPIRMTTDDGGVAVGENTYVDKYDSDTGTFTVDPAITATSTSDKFVVARFDVMDSWDRAIEALGRGLTRHATRPLKVPMTYVPNGDYQATSVSTGWTASAGSITFAYQDLAHPEGFYEQVLRATTSGAGANQYVESGDITFGVRENDVWRFAIPVRVVSGTSAAGKFVVRDKTNGADITLTLIIGDSATYSGLGWTWLKGELSIPDNCLAISVRLTVTTNSSVVDFGPVIMAPKDARLYTAQTHLETDRKIQGWWEGLIRGGTPTGPEQTHFEPVLDKPTTQHNSWGLSFEFDDPPGFPLFYEQIVNYPAITTDTATTDCPKELALAVMAFEFFKYADRKDRNTRTEGSQNRETRWADDLRRAELAMIQAKRKYGVVVKPMFVGAATGTAYA